jgi:predicted transcriptional regulator
VYYRIHKYGRIFQEKKRSKVNMVLISDVLISLGLFPILIITMLVWFDKGCYYNPILKTCITKLFWQISILGWLFTNSCIFVFSTWKLFKTVDNNFYNEKKALIWIAILGYIVTVIDAVILFTGKLETELGRNIYTISICLLHLFCVPRLSIYTLFKASKNDGDYSSNFKLSLALFSPIHEIKKYQTYHKLIRHEAFYLDYLTYCSIEAITRCIEGCEMKICNTTATTHLIASICSCLQRINTFRNSYKYNGITTREKILNDIVHTFILDPTSKELITIPNAVKEKLLLKSQITESSLDGLFLYLNDQLSVYFYDDYMKNILPKTAEVDLRKMDILEDLQSGGLLDVYEKNRILNTNIVI